MKERKFFRKIEKGQAIPMLVVALLAVIAMGALILDGGAILLNRREAQNAADAGALAGARILCSQDSSTWEEINAAVEKYTMDENNATAFEWEFTTENVGEIDNLKKGEIVVTAEVGHNSFLARIFGQDTLTAEATAAAGCAPYLPGVVLPIAYPCRTPEYNAHQPSSSDDCDYFPINWADFTDVLSTHNYDYLSGNPSSTQSRAISLDLYEEFKIYDEVTDEWNNELIYIVVNSDLVCGEDLNCDFTGEEDEVDRYQLNSGERGWLNLEGDIEQPSAHDIEGWILNGISGELTTHTWLSFIDGVSNTNYSDLDTRLDEIVWVPVFNYICDDANNLEESDCWVQAHLPDPPFGEPESGCNTDHIFNVNQPVAHIVVFAPFFPTCVQKNGKALYSGTSYNENCPGFQLAQDMNPDSQPPDYSTIDHNTSAFEGYFIDPDTLPEGDASSYGADIGVYKAFLTR